MGPRYASLLESYNLIDIQDTISLLYETRWFCGVYHVTLARTASSSGYHYPLVVSDYYEASEFKTP